MTNWRQDAARTRRLEACATPVAQPSWLRVHGASQLRVPDFWIFKQALSHNDAVEKRPQRTGERGVHAASTAATPIGIAHQTVGSVEAA